MDRNPGNIHAGATFDFDPEVISYWSQWLGHPHPQLLIVGQDFGDIEYFNKYRGVDAQKSETNDNLYRLLWHIGLKPGKPPREDRQTQVFLTNSILCLKEPPMNSAVRNPWIKACAVNHLQPLVTILNPPIVVGLGGPGWQATKIALDIKEAPVKISEAAGGQWRSEAGIRVFAVGHCGPLGIANRSLDKQLEDWSRIGVALRQFQ